MWLRRTAFMAPASGNADEGDSECSPSDPAHATAPYPRLWTKEARRAPGLFQAPGVGFEPTTLRLTAGCSAVELPRTVSIVLPRSIGG